MRGQQKVFETAQWVDFPLAFIVAGILSLIAASILTRWFLLALIGSPAVGVIIAEAVRIVTRRRRSNRLYLVAAIGLVAGGLPGLLFNLGLTAFSLMQFGAQGAGTLASLLPYGIYLFLATPAMFYRLKGINIR